MSGPQRNESSPGAVDVPLAPSPNVAITGVDFPLSRFPFRGNSRSRPGNKARLISPPLKPLQYRTLKHHENQVTID